MLGACSLFYWTSLILSIYGKQCFWCTYLWQSFQVSHLGLSTGVGKRQVSPLWHLNIWGQISWKQTKDGKIKPPVTSSHHPDYHWLGYCADCQVFNGVWPLKGTTLALSEENKVFCSFFSGNSSVMRDFFVSVWFGWRDFIANNESDALIPFTIRWDN